jgi:uncharacterized alpha-E superfamily protein
MIPKVKPRVPKPKRKKLPSIAKLRESCAVLLQKLVRLKAADENGYCRCVTCNKPDRWQAMQGGHYLERGKHVTCLIEENIHPQCPRCNQWEMKKTSGVLAYREYMVDMYGEDFVANLEWMAKGTAVYTRQYLEEMAVDLKKQISIQEQRLGI